MTSVADLYQFLDCNFDTGELFRYSRPNSKCFAVIDKDGYMYGTVRGKRIAAHRVIWAMHYGQWPQGQIDHINGIRSDNRIGNLRDVTSQENAQNRKLPPNNTSGTPGVYWHKRDKKWNARVTVNRIMKHIGSFESKDEAIAARKAAEANYGFHPNHGRRAA